jgi:serine protease Do
MKRTWRNGRGRLPALATITVAAVGIAALAEYPSRLQAAPPSIDGAVVDRAPSTGAVARLEDLSDAFASVAARVKPSVVYITAKQAARPVSERSGGQGGIDPNSLPPEFRQFFRDMPGMPGQPRAPRGGGVASGSGFIVSTDGYILTNNHVVDGASEVTVRLLNRREYKAKVVGRDPNTDVAVIKIDATGLTAAPLGNSDASRVGEWVLAVGNPLGENLTAWPVAADHPGLHPDRRGDQPGQLRGAARERAW